jgi:hypothetical protein
VSEKTAKTERIAQPSKPRNGSHRDVGQQRRMPKRFSRMDVREVDLYEGDAYTAQGVS